MKRFIIKFGLLSLLVFTVMNGLVIIFTDRTTFESGIIQKHELLDSTKGRKIIFVGGSSAAFGINSPKIKEELKINPVNMGLNIGLGLRFMLEEIRESIHEDDIVILIPEFNHFFSCFNGERTLLTIIHPYPQSLKYFTLFDQYKTVILSYPDYLFHQTANLPLRLLDYLMGKEHIKNHDYSIYAFNEFGDVNSHWNTYHPKDTLKGTVIIDMEIDEMEIDNQAIEYLNKYKHFCDSISASIYFLFPTIQTKYYLEHKALFDLFEQKIKSQLNIEFMYSLESVVMPRDYFYDTVYHLNKKGVDRRTKMIINFFNK